MLHVAETYYKFQTIIKRGDDVHLLQIQILCCETHHTTQSKKIFVLVHR
jgi:hypothetical protein